MPDTTDTKGTVDGIEPSILVKFVENSSLQDTTEVLRLFPFDNGNNRSITLDGDPVWITQKDLAAITGGHRVEIIETVPSTQTSIASVEPQKAPQNLQSSIPTPLPGQSGS